jgi:hypothetical protein
VATVHSFAPEWTKPSGGNAMSLAFRCADRGDREPWDAFWGQRYARVEDPDGNVVDLFAPL